MQYLVDRYDTEHKVSYPHGTRENWEVNNWVGTYSFLQSIWMATAKAGGGNSCSGRWEDLGRCRGEFSLYLGGVGYQD
jgi:hypothetical protein